jgi:hypothetical protein
MNSGIGTQRVSAGTMLVQEGLLLPKAAGLQSNRYSQGWRDVRILDRSGLDAGLRAAGWALLCIAGEIKVRILGRDGDANVGKAVRRILRQAHQMAFNCVGLNQITSTSFLGIPYLTISAQAYHIQPGPILDSVATRTRQRQDADWACR